MQGMIDRVARPFGGNLGQQPAKMRLLDHVQFSGSVLGRVTPLVGLIAHEGANRFAIAEVDELEREDLVDNSRQLLAGLGAVNLQIPVNLLELVDLLLKDA